MNKLVPDEWIIGRRKVDRRDKNSKVDETCYLTFVEGKDKQGRERLNSSTSFNNWSERELDIRFNNDFIEGWKLEEDFNQRSWQSNRKLFKIREPRHNHIFEVDVRELLPLLINVHIKDGVFQGKYALTKARSLISQAQFDKYYKETTRNINEKTIKEGDIMDVPRYGRHIYCGVYTKFSLDRHRAQDQEKLRAESLHYFFPTQDNAITKKYSWRAHVISRASIRMDKLGEATPEELKKAKAAALKEVQEDNWSRIANGFEGPVTKNMKFSLHMKVADKQEGDAKMVDSYFEKDGIFYADQGTRYDRTFPYTTNTDSYNVTHTLRRIELDQENLALKYREPVVLRYTIKNYNHQNKKENPTGYRRATLLVKVNK